MIYLDQIDQLFAYFKSVNDGYSLIQSFKKEDLSNNPYWWNVNGKIVLPAENGKVYKIWKNADGLKAYGLFKYGKAHNCPIFNPVTIEHIYPTIDTVITSEPLVQVNKDELSEEALKKYCDSKRYDFDTFKSLQIVGYSSENSGFSENGDLVLFDYIANVTAVFEYDKVIRLFNTELGSFFEEAWDEN